MPSVQPTTLERFQPKPPTLEPAKLAILLRDFDDDQIVSQVRAGNVSLFEVLMRRHNQTVFRAARAILRVDDEAEDVMQHAYVRAFEHIADYRGQAKFSTWLTRIAVYEALARLRRRKPLTPIDGENTLGAEAMVAEGANPEQRVGNAEYKAITEAAIDELPDDFRLVFVMRAVEQMSVAEVAECLDIAPETVRTRFFRARQRLQQTLSSRLEATAPLAFDFHLSRCDRVVHAVLTRILGLPET